MASYTAEKGAILQPGNQINRLSSYNTEGVFGWPGFELYELVGYVKVDNLAADKAAHLCAAASAGSMTRRNPQPASGPWTSSCTSSAGSGGLGRRLVMTLCTLVLTSTVASRIVSHGDTRAS